MTPELERMKKKRDELIEKINKDFAKAAEEENQQKKKQCCEETNTQLKRIADALEKLVGCSCPERTKPNDENGGRQ